MASANESFAARGLKKSLNELVLGIRSENIQLCDPSDDNKVADAQVNVLENRGDVFIIHLEINQNAGGDPSTQKKSINLANRVDLIARQTSGIALRENQQVGFRFDPVAIHWFDGATGKNLAKE